MRLGPYRFCMPGLWPTLLTVATLSLLLQAGFWQWQRAAYKETLLADFARGGEGAVPQLANVGLRQFEAMRFATVMVRGRFVRPEVLFLDNRPQDGRMGYHVLGVMQAEGQQERLLVNLGWVPLEDERARLPKVALPQGELEFPARLKPISRPMLALGTALDVRDGGRLVMPVLDPERVSEWLGEPLLPVEALVDPSAGFGYVRAWQAHYDIPPIKHRAYAFQWFAMALAVVAIFVIVNSKRVARTAGDAPDDKPEAIPHGDDRG